MKITIHKETLYILSLVLSALAIAMSVVANLGTSVYAVPAIALARQITISLPAGFNPIVGHVIGSQPFAELMINTAFLIMFCIIIRKFRPMFLLSFVTTFIYACFLYGFQWIPAFWPEINHQYPLYLRIVLLVLAVNVLSLSIAMSFKAYIYPPMVVFVQKGIPEHFHIKRAWIVVFACDLLFMVVSIFIIYAIYNDWQFWNYNLSYGTLINALMCGPLSGIYIHLLDKTTKTKTLFPKWEKAFQLEQEKGY